MLELVDVITFYGDSLVLRGVSLEVKEGSVVALLGRNGMGKTTTIRSIIGFTRPRQGAVRFKGKEITSLPAHKIAQAGIGLVPQGRRIFPSLSVSENLMVAMRNRGRRQSWDLGKVYSHFPILKERADSRGSNLSGGEQQILAIARALLGNPDLLLLDEPSEGLAPMIVQEIRRIIQQLKGSGISILLVESNLTLALSVADYIYIIGNGIIVYECTPTELRDNNEITTNYLGV
jgi:branched-chain amino acid transport system ATP-binding protein